MHDRGSINKTKYDNHPSSSNSKAGRLNTARLLSFLCDHFSKLHCERSSLSGVVLTKIESNLIQSRHQTMPLILRLTKDEI
jgi:hypothetical protein